MNIRCSNCHSINRITDSPSHQYKCGKCGAFLQKSSSSGGDTSQAVGLIGGAALGAAIGGPVGAVVGGVLGAILGKEGKGVG